jgi:hypothetical protein
VQAVNGRVAEVYLSVPNVAIQGVLVRIRTALAELVAELTTLTPQDQDVPDKTAADQAVQFVVTGKRPVINYTVQRAADGGTNVAVNSGDKAGPVTVSGAHGSVVGGQAVQAGRDAFTAGQGAAMPGAVDQGWWARLRKRGAVVAFSTIIGAIAVVVGTAVGIFVWIGWTP